MRIAYILAVTFAIALALLLNPGVPRTSLTGLSVLPATPDCAGNLSFEINLSAGKQTYAPLETITIEAGVPEGEALNASALSAEITGPDGRSFLLNLTPSGNGTFHADYVQLQDILTGNYSARLVLAGGCYLPSAANFSIIPPEIFAVVSASAEYLPGEVTLFARVYYPNGSLVASPDFGLVVLDDAGRKHVLFPAITRLETGYNISFSLRTPGAYTAVLTALRDGASATANASFAIVPEAQSLSLSIVPELLEVNKSGGIEVLASTPVQVQLEIVSPSGSRTLIDGASGRFSFTPAEEGVYAITAAARAGSRSAHASAAANVSQRKIRLAGTLRDSLGNPLKGRISVKGADFEAGSSGAFDLSIPAGRHEVSLDFEGFVVKRVEMREFEFSGDLDRVADVQEVPGLLIGGKMAAAAFALNPAANCSSASVTFLYGDVPNPSLFKCRNWDYANSFCAGDWVRVAVLPPGPAGYSYSFDCADPGFGVAEAAPILNGNFSTGAQYWTNRTSAAACTSGWDNTGRTGGSTWSRDLGKNNICSVFWNQSFSYTGTIPPDAANLTFCWNVTTFAGSPSGSTYLKAVLNNPGGGSSVLWTSPLIAATTSMSCPNITIGLNNFSAAGTYNLTLQSDLDTTSGTSSAEIKLYHDDVNLTIWYTQYGSLNATLLMPNISQTTNVTQNATFVINATVTCGGGSNRICPAVNGTARYNFSSALPAAKINTTTGDRPLYTLSGNPQSCGQLNTTGGQDTCTLSWTVNATGGIGTRWLVDVNFSSANGNVSANDTANAEILIVQGDAQGPSISVQVPASGQNFSSASVPLNFTAGDSSGVSSCRYELANSSGSFNVSVSGCQNVSAMVGVTEGSNTVRVWANDTLNNWNVSALVSFRVDTVPPTVNVQVPVQNQNFSSLNVPLNYTVGDVGGVSFCRYELSNSSGSFNVSVSGCQNVSAMVGVTEGSNSVRVWANDSVNNWNASSTVFFSVDTVLPSITVQYPQNTTYASLSVPLNFSVFDSSGVSSCKYELNGQNTSLPACQNATIAAAERNNSIRVWANDTVNNWNASSPVFFSVTLPLPISIQSPGNTTYASSSVSLNYTAGSGTYNVSQCKYELDGGNTSLTVCQNSTLSSLLEGNHSVKVWSNDTMNNWYASSTVYFSVDTIKPAVSFVSPADVGGANLTRNWSFVNVSVSDASYTTAFVDWNSSLAGWWRFNGESGENSSFFRDWSSYGNNGSCYACPVLNSSGRFGSALQFDGADDFVSVPDSSSLGLSSAFTIEGWFRPSTNFSGYSDYYEGLLDKGSYQLFLDKSDGKLKLFMDSAAQKNWSALGSGTDGSVYALAVWNGSLYASGSFASPASNIARWNGSGWSALGSGMNNAVYSLVVWNGSLYAGGTFTTAGGVSANRTARWDGSAWSALGSGMNNTVYSLVVWNGSLYAGGTFTTAGGVSANRTARWNGSGWSALGSGMGGGTDVVYSLAVWNGSLYAGGAFSSAGGVSANRTARWNGSGWSALGSGMSGGGNTAYSLAVWNGSLYAGGDFTSAGGVSANYSARWNGSGWSALGSGMDAPVRSLVVYAGDLYADGDFSTADGVTVSFVARWNGSAWGPLGAGIEGGFFNLYSLAAWDGSLYAGGFFYAGGSSPSMIARWSSGAERIVGSGTGSWPSDWHYFAVTYDNSSLKLYRNGALESSVGANGSVASSFRSLLFGKTYGSQAAGGSGEQFAGILDEVRIHRRALGPEEVNASFNSGAYRLYHNFTGIGVGQYSYLAYAQDAAGNVNNTETRALNILQNRAPNVTNVHPGNSSSQWFHSSPLNVSWNATDPDGDSISASELQYSNNSGSIWQPIGNASGTTLSYPWRIRNMTSFTKQPGNPVLVPAQNWDLWGIGGQSVLYNGTHYLMWYFGTNDAAWNTNFSIGLATSTDGVSWTEYSGNPVLNFTKGTWEDQVRGMSVVYENGVYKMWYTGLTDTNIYGAIGFANSTDGIAWSKYSGNPVIPTVFNGLDVDEATDPTVLHIMDTYHMWYTLGYYRSASGKWLYNVSYATSPDGLAWTKRGVVLSSDGGGGIDSNSTSQPAVVFDNSEFKMLYVGLNLTGYGKIMYATSENGVNWTKHGTVIPQGAAGAWDSYYASAPDFLLINRTWRIWYRGWNNTWGYPDQIGFANATDWRIGDNNSYQVRVRAKDAVNGSFGGWNSSLYDFGIDTAPPNSSDNAPAGWQAGAVTVNFSCSDTLSGCNSTYYRLDSGNWTSGSSVAVSTNGNHTLEYYSLDNAGNNETMQYSLFRSSLPRKAYVAVNMTVSLSASLNAPTAGSTATKAQYETFAVNATVTCTGACGNVNGTVRYNYTSAQPDTRVNTTAGDVPVYTLSGNPQSCGSLSSGQSCSLQWSVNATGLGSYLMDVNFTASSTSAKTGNFTLSITSGGSAAALPSCGNATLSYRIINSTGANYLVRMNLTGGNSTASCSAYVALFLPNNNTASPASGSGFGINGSAYQDRPAMNSSNATVSGEFTGFTYWWQFNFTGTGTVNISLNATGYNDYRSSEIFAGVDPVSAGNSQAGMQKTGFYWRLKNLLEVIAYSLKELAEHVLG